MFQQNCNHGNLFISRENKLISSNNSDSSIEIIKQSSRESRNEKKKIKRNTLLSIFLIYFLFYWNLNYKIFLKKKRHNNDKKWNKKKKNFSSKVKSYELKEQFRCRASVVLLWICCYHFSYFFFVISLDFLLLEYVYSRLSGCGLWLWFFCGCVRVENRRRL